MRADKDNKKGKVIDAFALLKSKGFNLKDCHLAQQDDKLSLLLEDSLSVGELIDRGFSPKEIVLLRVEVLRSLLGHTEGVEALMRYGFEKEYLLIIILELMCLN